MCNDPEVTVSDVLFSVCAAAIAVAFSWMGVSIVMDGEAHGRRLIGALGSFVIAASMAYVVAVVGGVFVVEGVRRLRADRQR